MEHIPRVKNPFGVAPTVPLLNPDIVYGDQPFGFQGFENFPRLHGFNLASVRLSENDDNQLLSFLQSWLFFGLLTETFGKMFTQYSNKQFICTTDGHWIVTTEALQKCAWHWLAVRIHDPRETVIEHAQQVDACLRLANTVLNRVTAHETCPQRSSAITWSAVNAVLLSLITVAEFLCRARNLIVTYSQGPSLVWSFPFLDKALLAAGWCVGEIANLWDDCDASCRFYLSTIDRWVLQKDHINCDRAKGCLAHQIRYSSYSMKHTSNCQSLLGCNEVGPSTEVVAAIIEDGNIPLVTMRSDASDAGVNVKALGHQESSSSHKDFVAISHVWSDGMGNNHRNCLHRCVLSRIQTLVNELYEVQDRPIPFWMDTLCIPKGREYAPAKNLAIIGMADVYKLADKVLVLDNSLETCSSKISNVEILTRIGYSPWMTRVWTLQEARLSRDLLFQFKEKAVNIDHLRNAWTDSRNLIAISGILQREENIQLRANPNSMRLVRALACYEPNQDMLSYAKLPVQEDPAQEELRLAAIQNMSDYAEEQQLAEIWMPVVFAASLEDEFSEVDHILREWIHALLFDTILMRSRETLVGAMGFIYEYSTVSGRVNLNKESRPHILFFDVCRGFRGRTTSRLEDETICLGILLGIELSDIQAIKPMDWRLKDAIISAYSKRSIKALTKFFGTDILKWTQRCHEKRMKMLLSYIKLFPASVIFWPGRRLQEEYWRWAPFSVMHKDIKPTSHAEEYVSLTKRGLRVTFPAFRLNCLVENSAPCSSTFPVKEPRISFLNKSRKWSDRTVLVIHTDHDDEFGPWRRSWQRVRLRQQSYDDSKRVMRICQQQMRKGATISLAVLIKGDVEGDQGVLVDVYGKEDGCNLASHVMLVEKVSEDMLEERGTLVTHVSGTWEPHQTWCIG